VSLSWTVIVRTVAKPYFGRSLEAQTSGFAKGKARGAIPYLLYLVTKSVSYLPHLRLYTSLHRASLVGPLPFWGNGSVQIAAAGIQIVTGLTLLCILHYTALYIKYGGWNER
jgi:hypothetical protein